MENGANAVHKRLLSDLADYLRTQYFGKSPVLLSAIEDKLLDENVLFRRPYVESSPAYKIVRDGIQRSETLPEWLKDYFKALSEKRLGVFPSPFQHQISALESAYNGEDVFVSTGTGSGKTECFIWPLLAKLADEARNRPKSWRERGVRAIVMYPMNALVSDQIGRLRRLIGDRDGNFVDIFRKFCGAEARRPQFGMYTGRTPYPGKAPVKTQDESLAKTYEETLTPENAEEKEFVERLIRDGRFPAKKSYVEFIEKLKQKQHVPNAEDAELVTRFEMQKYCPDILITNYSMLEYMLFRPRERKIWADTKARLAKYPDDKILFVVDEAHMYRGSAGGEVSLLIRRLFHKLGIDRSRAQFILTTASMPHRKDEEREAVRVFANSLTACNKPTSFRWLMGEREEIQGDGVFDIPFSKLATANPESFEGSEAERLAAHHSFWKGTPGYAAPFDDVNALYRWLYENLKRYKPFVKLLQACRGEAVSLLELAERIFPNEAQDQALHAVSVMLAIATAARNDAGNVLFPARLHMLFRGLKGVCACANPDCPNCRERNGLKLGEAYLSDEKTTCEKCGSAVYELCNDRRCGALFFKGYVSQRDFEARRKTYLWRNPGLIDDEEKICEICLFIPSERSDEPQVAETRDENLGKRCYLDVKSGFLYFDDRRRGAGFRALYYGDYVASGRPDVYTFKDCPHCRHALSKMQLTTFNTRGNLAFFNLIKAQFQTQPAVVEKTNQPDRFPNEGRKVLLFSDSRQRAAKLARDMSDASDATAARQLAALAIRRMEQENASLDYFYDFFAMVAFEKNVRLFDDEQRKKLFEDGERAFQDYQERNPDEKYEPRFTINNAPDKIKEHLLRFYCDGYNTFVDTAVGWLEPTDSAMRKALRNLEKKNVVVAEELFLSVFNAWILYICDKYVALGQSISDRIRRRMRRFFGGYGLEKSKIDALNVDVAFSPAIRAAMQWEKNDKVAQTWLYVLNAFLDDGQSDNKRKRYVDLTQVKPRLSLPSDADWFRCRRCSELTPYLLMGKCPICGSSEIGQAAESELDALNFWRQPIKDALQGEKIRLIDVEEHTAQLSHKDQRDALWAKTEQYELRFQDFLRPNETPVDILSSTTTMEVGVDIGSLVAVGLRNIPPMRENYQQRAGRAGRRGASLSTIVTFCEDGPHDSLYFNNPVPMFRGDPRRPWIDVGAEKIICRHFNMIALQSYLETQTKDCGLDDAPAVEFLAERLTDFGDYLETFVVDDALVPPGSRHILSEYKKELTRVLNALKVKSEKHPELFETRDAKFNKKKSLLDALFEEGAIPTYSFPKNVVSVYIPGEKDQLQYSVERSLDVALGEYAPGRSIVVDKTTYQIGGLYYPGGERNRSQDSDSDGASFSSSPAKAFVTDPAYVKTIIKCDRCHWYGLQNDGDDKCPFCGNASLTKEKRQMVRPWGFAPKDAKSIEEAQLEEKYSFPATPLYSTLPKADDVSTLEGWEKIRVATRSNQRIIVLNKGVGDKGFVLCEDCGAMAPGDNIEALKDLKRPYKSRDRDCKHSKFRNVDLGYDFITDMLVLEFKLDPSQIVTEATGNSWLNRAGQSLAEALRLQACRELDVEYDELATGYRVRNDGEFVDVYLYDSLSSGAGYAVGVRASIDNVLEGVQKMLSECECDGACQDCLKHYRNQFVHRLLDRRAALSLLNWGKSGELPADVPFERATQLLKPLRQILKDYQIQLTSENGVWRAEGVVGEKKIVVVYPAMRTKPREPNAIFISDAQLQYSKPLAVKVIEQAVRDR